MNLLITFLLIAVALFGVLAWFGLRVVGRARRREQRHRLIQLASSAAADESSQALMALLDALDQEKDGQCPVTVKWLPHYSARNPVPSVLVTISWDGNEWRRVSPLAALREQVEIAFKRDHGHLAQQFRKDLSSYEVG